MLPVTALHMGALHPLEQALTLVLAFGPFVVLGFVIARRRRLDRRESQGRGEALTDVPQRDR